ncbi:hypothetical protein PG988_011881 [Apiospora saccharicola]
MHYQVHYLVPNAGLHPAPGITQTFTVPFDVNVPTSTVTETATETVTKTITKIITKTVAPTNTAISPFNASVEPSNWLAVSSTSPLLFCLVFMALFYCLALLEVQSHRDARQGLKGANETYEKAERLLKELTDQVKTVKDEVADASKVAGKHKTRVISALEVVERRLTAHDTKEKVVQSPRDVVDEEQDSGSDSWDHVDNED